MDEKKRKMLQGVGLSDLFIERMAYSEEKPGTPIDVSDLGLLRRRRELFEYEIKESFRRQGDARKRLRELQMELDRYKLSFWRRLFTSKKKILAQIETNNAIELDAPGAIRYWTAALEDLQAICLHPHLGESVRDSVTCSIGFRSCFYCGLAEFDHFAK